jgi:hypothetical protein
MENEFNKKFATILADEIIEYIGFDDVEVCGTVLAGIDYGASYEWLKGTNKEELRREIETAIFAIVSEPNNGNLTIPLLFRAVFDAIDDRDLLVLREFLNECISK